MTWRTCAGTDRRLAGRRTDHPEFAAFAATALTAHEDIDTAIGEIRRLDEEEGGMSSPPETLDAIYADSRGGIARTRGILGRLVLLAVMVLLLGQIVVTWFAVTGFERALEPQLNQKAGGGGTGGIRPESISWWAISAFRPTSWWAWSPSSTRSSPPTPTSNT